MERVMRALELTRQLLAAQDQATAAVELAETPRYSPLRTLVDQAERAAGEVLLWLRTGP